MICNARFGHGIRSCGRRCCGRACAIRPPGSERGMCAERRQFGRRNPPAGTAVYEKKESAVPRANIGDPPDSEEIFFEFFFRSRTRLATVTLPGQIVREMMTEKRLHPIWSTASFSLSNGWTKKIQRLFFRGDCTHRANACASSAVDAYVRVDAVNITFLDCSGRAFTLTCAACYAVGLRNFVSHFQYPLKLLLLSAFP